MNRYFSNILYNLSRLGNSLAGGNPEITISARIGEKKKKNRYWAFAQNLVDFTFYPMQGGGHCFRAWLRHKDELFIDTGNPFAFIALTSIYCFSCSFIIPFTWVFGWLYRL